MRFTKGEQLKNQNSRKTGYYWIVWAMEPDGVTEYKRIGYYNSNLGQWYMPGDNRAYLDTDLLGVYEIPVDDLPGIKFWTRVIGWAAAVIVIWFGTGLVKFLIDYLLK